ncbi:LURP-one-related/scramblase family protein [Phytohabitans suffuscus]|uniref:Scramblase n=1 Tax=Phytohabitans suffuscus TaxID=624315 RepID=A0A6F8YJJ3_9ACTN|nr:hypothetical protein [Phytohabitans suffuscus]BCB86247.1 hypothetical protein Psuf_035600 [Phytohabitans suffuscus]
MDLQQLQSVREFAVRQSVRMSENRYEVHAVGPDGSEGGVVAFAEQKRADFKRGAVLYTDESRRQRVLSFQPSGSAYAVTDADGVPLGEFRKASGRTVWVVEQPGLPPVSGKESSPTVSTLRKVSGDLFWLPYEFEFTRAGGGTVFTVAKSWSVRDKFTIAVPDPHLDRRLVIAVAVALDAIANR